MISKAWIDAHHPMVNHRLWGLTLLERNIRELHKLQVNEIVICTNHDLDPVKHFCHAPPKSLTLRVVRTDTSQRWGCLSTELENSPEPVLVLEGHAFNDRRVLKELLACRKACGVVSPNGSTAASAAIVTAEVAPIFSHGDRSLTETIAAALSEEKLAKLDLSEFDPYIENLRRRIPPFLLLVEGEKQVREMDRLLRQQVHKGVLEFVAKYIHPPLEFGAVKLIAHTPISPNLITIIWLILAAIAVPLFATGHLLAGIILAVISGVLDGVDGKLARLTLRFSKTGDMLDHIGGTVYDAVWYLALGWYFSGGDPNSTGATFTFILFISYLVERVVPGIFRKMHKAEIHDYAAVDIFVRFVGSRMNNNIWLLLVGIVFGLARQTFYFISVWMLATATWHTLRLVYVTWRKRTGKPALIHSESR